MSLFKRKWCYFVSYHFVRDGKTGLGCIATLNCKLNTLLAFRELIESLKKETKSDDIVILNWKELDGER